MSLHRHTNYRIEGDQHLIEIKLRELRQLFNSLDPAPFHEKDLDVAAEEYIVEAVRELGARQHSKLVIYLPATSDAETDAIPAAIHNYFAYRARQAGIELQQLLRLGVASLSVGLTFLGLCLMLRELLIQPIASPIITEGLLIVGWVALWRPLEVFLYEWWPILRRQRRLLYIAKIPVEVRTDG